ncbi:ankyrin repeat-containing domain protein [Mycena rosella]|uniref:Ankyrin repeat-containing domain protein n=1 Tax=Mycena rosella TaxID=1033263 RepID=A0AAD7CXR5_MYCRO|nr:ankyrin repeat-containing domain protein [Mycena rosella]
MTRVVKYIEGRQKEQESTQLLDSEDDEGNIVAIRALVKFPAPFPIVCPEQHVFDYSLSHIIAPSSRDALVAECGVVLPIGQGSNDVEFFLAWKAEDVPQVVGGEDKQVIFMTACTSTASRRHSESSAGSVLAAKSDNSLPQWPEEWASISPETEPIAPAQHMSRGQSTVDNVAAVLELFQQIANIIQKVPVIAPAAALMSVILKAYKEIKDTNEKRDILLANITDLSHDLCSAILWMDSTNQLDFLRRLKADLDTYGDLEVKLEKWLQSPDMKQKHLETLRLRKDGTGLWLLEGDTLMHWQDNPGPLWIMAGTGKSVLSSAVISKLQRDTQLFQAMKNCPPPPAIAFFYFDFKDKEGQAIDSALQRILLQLSAQSPHPYSALEKQYILMSHGQTLPAYEDLLKILEELLLEIGRTYIVLDALDDGSKPHCSFFKDGFENVPHVILEADLLQDDIRLFVTNELQKLPSWAHHAADRVVSKSNGMFRLAACLIVEISHCEWKEELDEALDNLPNDLVGVYDRFLHTIRPKSFAYAEAALRWLMFSQHHVDLEQLADAVAFDYSNPTQYMYRPSRREDNRTGLTKWFEGLAVFNEDSVTLAHASVQDYLLSTRFGDRFRCNLSASHSHTFIAQTCIAYLLHFSDNAPNELSNNSLDNISRNYPLPKYAAQYWCHHLLRSHDQTLLSAGAMRLLVDESPQYCAMIRLRRQDNPGIPLHFCCQEGYIEGVHALLVQGADPNAAEEEQGSVLYAASEGGHLEIVRLLLEKGADVNAPGGLYGSALQAGSTGGQTDLVRLLLENGADVHTTGGEYGNIVHLLLENGANVNTTGGKYGSSLQAASVSREMDIVRLLLENGADIQTMGKGYGSALQAASAWGRTDIAYLLLENGADVNTPGGYYGSALQAGSAEGHTDLVRLLLENGADVHTMSREYGGALQTASSGGYTDLVRLLLENGIDVNAMGGKYGSALQAASAKGHTDTVCLLLENGAEINTTGGKYGSALQAASAMGHTEIVRLLLENGTDLNAPGGKFGSALQAATSRGHTNIVDILREKGAKDIC